MVAPERPRYNGSMFSTIHDQMCRAVSDRLFPGAVLAVCASGKPVFFEAFGHAALLPDPTPMTRETLFDLASLTKPLVTTTLVMILVAEGRLGLDTPVARYFRSWDSGDKARITVRHLLTHTSGLPAWQPLYRMLDPALAPTTQDKDSILRAVAREPLVSEPGAISRYSDLGFMVLGSVVEAMTGTDLDHLSTERIFKPLGLVSSFYLPIGSASTRERLAGRSVAATEDCPWRGRVLRGEVHDENAYAMGGVAGHAGLFADARDVSRLVMAWRDAQLGFDSFLPSNLVSEWVTRQTGLGDGGWALGWTVPTPPSTSGRHFSSRSFGHLGFTGTSIWVDPAADLAVVLLTNRVHPTRTNDGLSQFRPVIHDLIYEAVVGGSAR